MAGTASKSFFSFFVMKPVSTTWSSVGNLCFTADEIDLRLGITFGNEQQEPENKDECEVHPANEASAQHPRLLVVARDVEGD